MKTAALSKRCRVLLATAVQKGASTSSDNAGAGHRANFHADARIAWIFTRKIAFPFSTGGFENLDVVTFQGPLQATDQARLADVYA